MEFKECQFYVNHKRSTCY